MATDYDNFDNDIEYADEDGDNKEEIPLPKKKPPFKSQSRPQSQPQVSRAPPSSPQSAQEKAIKQAAPVTEAQARYIPYHMPKRIGVLDRTTGKPIIEDEEMLNVIMAQLTDIKNDLEEIKNYYS